MPRPRIIGKGLTEKRVRIVRALTAHIHNLTVLGELGPYTPAPRTWEPRARQTPEEWADYWARRGPVAKWSPRERPALRYKTPGAEALTDAEVAAWVAGDEFVRSGLRPATQRALAYLATFAPPAPAKRLDTGGVSG